jgi:hypothetical protein
VERADLPGNGHDHWLSMSQRPSIRSAGLELRTLLVIPRQQGITHSHAAAAPRGALLYPRLSREGLEGRFLGLMADLDGKPEGDNSMPGK